MFCRCYANLTECAIGTTHPVDGIEEPCYKYLLLTNLRDVMGVHSVTPVYCCD